VVFVNDRNELVTPRTDFERSALEGTTLKRCDGGGGGGPR
jgi:hypothetical protein